MIPIGDEIPRKGFWKSGGGLLALVVILILTSPYLAFCWELRTRSHRRDAEQFYASRLEGLVQLPAERQVREVMETPGYMGGGNYVVRFTLPPTREPAAWIRAIRELNAIPVGSERVGCGPRPGEYFVLFSND